jgi:hypothetical protein
MTIKAGAWIFLLVFVQGLAGCNRSNSLDTPFVPSPPAPPTTPPTISNLAVTAVEPKNGLSGSQVHISGSGFSSGATVTLGGIATNVFVANSTLITATVPAGGTGTVDVVVTNTSGESATLAGGFTYEVVTLTVSATVVEPGGQLSVSWVVPIRRFGDDWIGLFKVGDPNTNYENSWWRYTNDPTSGTFTLNAPTEPGEYEFRYLLNDGYIDAGRSTPVTVSASAERARTTRRSTNR